MADIGDISDEVAARALAASGRRCCICRRFKPVRLQVHHIKERKNGGTGDFENVMPVCFNCHSDVHSTVPFVRRFSELELKLHRDATYKLVAEGRLIDEEVDAETVREQVLKRVRKTPGDFGLSAEATEMLLEAAEAGLIAYDFHLEIPNRELARRKRAFTELVEAGLIENENNIVFPITDLGYQFIDDSTITDGDASE